MLDRRSVVAAGLAGLASPALAQAPRPGAPLMTGSPMFDGPLARNRLARLFRPMPAGLPSPDDIALLDRRGRRRWAELKGRVHLVSLWAEWCAPCLSEAREFAALEHRHGGRDFGVVAMLTASHKKLDLDGAQAVLAKAKAPTLPFWIEPAGGERLYKDLTVASNGQPTLPCTLLVDRDARIRGRMFGAPSNLPPDMMPKPGEGPRQLSEELKQKLLAGELTTAWGSPDADRFVEALISGALN